MDNMVTLNIHRQLSLDSSQYSIYSSYRISYLSIYFMFLDQLTVVILHVMIKKRKGLKL
jgi:hypothetical protein